LRAVSPDLIANCEGIESTSRDPVPPHRRTIKEDTEKIESDQRTTKPQFWTHAYLAACHAALEHRAEAEEQVKKTLPLKPEFTVSTFSGFLPYRNSADCIAS
jgi:hypothetical protein